MARLTTTGTLDSSFGSAGFVINHNMVNGHNIVQAANGDLLTAGTVSTINKNYDVSDDFGVAAFLPTNGALDATFGNNGTATAHITGGADLAKALALQSDGKIVAAAFSAD